MGRASDGLCHMPMDKFVFEIQVYIFSKISHVLSCHVNRFINGF